MVGINQHIPEKNSLSKKEEIAANKQLMVSIANNTPTIDKIENLNNSTKIIKATIV